VVCGVGSGGSRSVRKGSRMIQWRDVSTQALGELVLDTVSADYIKEVGWKNFDDVESGIFALVEHWIEEAADALLHIPYFDRYVIDLLYFEVSKVAFWQIAKAVCDNYEIGEGEGE